MQVTAGRNSPGSYYVRFPRLIASNKSAAFVTAELTSPPARCKLTSWSPFSSSETKVDVKCMYNDGSPSIYHWVNVSDGTNQYQ